jgi:hypothetical protein
MYLTASKSSPKQTTFKPVPAGTHLGRLYRLVDIGTQQGEWEGKITNQRKIIFYFELFGEDESGQPLVRDDGKPLMVTKYYNRSLHEKSTMRKHLQAWLKVDFDNLDEPFSMADLLGKFAMVSVSNYKSKANEIKASIDSLSAVPAMLAKHGMPEGVNELMLFDLDKFDSEKFQKLSESIRGLIEKSPEFRKVAQGKPASGADDDMNDPIPF